VTRGIRRRGRRIRGGKPKSFLPGAAKMVLARRDNLGGEGGRGIKRSLTMREGPRVNYRGGAAEAGRKFIFG